MKKSTPTIAIDQTAKESFFAVYGRVAPNNQFPETHFIEVYSDGIKTNQQYKAMYDDSTSFYVRCEPIRRLSFELERTAKSFDELKTVALFKIRKNKVPTLHNFNQ